MGNYVKPAATISTVGRTYQPQTVVQQPSYNYVQPAASSLFNVIDANGDGKISQTEFTNYITGATNYVQPAANYVPAAQNYVKPAATISTVGRAYNYQPSVVQQAPAVARYVQPAASSLFNVIDVNGDGKISQTEFVNYITGATNYVQPAATTATVAPAANYVTQPRTFATVAPAANYVSQPTTYIQPAATSVFSTIDTNGDGKISRSEFASFLGQTAPLATTYAPSPTIFRG